MIPKFMFSKIKAKFYLLEKSLRTVCSVEPDQVSCNNIFAGGILCADELPLQWTAIGQVMSGVFLCMFQCGNKTDQGLSVHYSVHGLQYFTPFCAMHEGSVMQHEEILPTDLLK